METGEAMKRDFLLGFLLIYVLSISVGVFVLSYRQDRQIAKMDIKINNLRNELKAEIEKDTTLWITGFKNGGICVNFKEMKITEAVKMIANYLDVEFCKTEAINKPAEVKLEKRKPAKEISKQQSTGWFGSYLVGSSDPKTAEMIREREAWYQSKQRGNK